MIRSSRPRLEDIDQNIRIILERVKGRTVEDLRHDLDLRYVIHHALMIIAEAVRNLPPESTATYPDIAWGRVIGIGNKIKHEYHCVDPVVVWAAVTVHLTPLQAVIEEMLAEVRLKP